MSRGAYYNEIEPYAAEWLRNLIKKGLIADGEVDERSIVDVRGDDLRGFRQCHFFAGIGVWSYALRLAGWPDDREVWTGSCPCQPFSAAGKRKGTEDERHLWPEFYRLIGERRPPVVFGEQVASADGLAWFDTVSADMEGSGYAIAAADLCAAGVGAPHIRQRLWFIADRLADAPGGQPERASGIWAGSDETEGGRASGQPARRGDAGGLGNSDCARHEGDGLWSLHGGWEGRGPLGRASRSGSADRVADASGEGLEVGSLTSVGRGDVRQGGQAAAEDELPGSVADAELHEQWSGGRPGGEDQAGHEPWLEPGGCGEAGGLADAGHGEGAARESGADRQAEGRGQEDHDQAQCCGGDCGPGPTNGHWRAADWLHCRDGKWRPVEPGTFPLVDGIAFKLGSGSALEGKSRIGMLRAYGNAIAAPVAQEFISAYMECRP